MISSIFSLEIIKVLNPNPNIFLWIAASVAHATAVNPNGFKMLLDNGLSTSPIKDNCIFSNSPKIYLKIPLIVLFYVIGLLIILY